MKCVTYSEFGPSSKVLKYQEFPTPEPKKGEVLVKLHFSGVNPSDAKARAGSRPGVLKPQFDTIIPNSDGSGEIIKIGKEVDKKRLGERVWIWNGQWQRPYGTASEFIALPSEQAITIPEKMSFETGACLGIPGLTAAQCALGDGSLKGKTILISGGAGSVGNLSIQLAKWSGARVIATGSATGFDRINNAGADYIFEYNDTQLAQKILDISPSGVDRVIEVEFGTNINLFPEIMRPYSVLSVYGSAKNMVPTIPFGPYLYKGIQISIELIYILPQTHRLRAIKNLHDAHTDKALVPEIEKIYNLSECALAHDKSLTPGRAGAILLNTG